MAQKWMTTSSRIGKQTGLGIRCTFVRFENTQKGYVYCAPGSRQLYISGDIMFDENFSSTIATAWKLHHDKLAVQPFSRDIPNVTATLEQTGGIEHHPMLAINNAGIEEGKNTSSAPHTTNGNAHNDINDTNDINYVPDLLHPDDDSSVSKDEFDYDNYDDVILDMEQPITNEEPEISPHGT